MKINAIEFKNFNYKKGIEHSNNYIYTKPIGVDSVSFSGVKKELPRHKVLFNTVPQGIALEDHTGSCIKIDLASFPGLEGHDIIRARGLPGKYAPESAGKLIAETICRMDKEERI